MKCVVGLVYLLLLNFSLLGAEYRVFSAEELSRLNLTAGDRVILEQGDWTDQKLVFKGVGTAEKPIILTVENPGSVVLTGNSSLVIDGSWLVVDGLSFRDGYTLKENVISFSDRSDNCRLTNTSIIDYNNPDSKVRNSWIVLYGFRNRVDHCYIKGKTHVGTTIGVYVSDEPNHHRIDHNYFDGRPPLGRNGGEIIRMGTDQWSMHDSYTIVEENIFAHCDGEIEIVSNKSTNNTIRNNLFYESKGMLTLRHGNKALVYGNYFIGNHKEGTGGIRIIGEGHRIHNNYMYGLTGTGLNAAVSFMNAWGNPPLHGYWQIKDTEVRNNTIINCAESIVIGSGKNEKTFLPPVNSLIANNIIKTRTPIIVWTEPTARNSKSVKFENNIVFGMEEEEEYPDGISVEDPLFSVNSFGFYETERRAKQAMGAGRLNKIMMSLLNGKNAGPSWMQLEGDFVQKTKPKDEAASGHKVKVLRNLRYGKKPMAVYAADTSSDRLLDMYIPSDESGGRLPVFVFIHGGGFAGGDKSALNTFWKGIASKGYVVLSVNYRLYLKHHKTKGASATANMSKGLRKDGLFHPELQKAVDVATEDVTEVLAWIKGNAEKYNLDESRVAVSGGSAGAMTALHLAYGTDQNVLLIKAVVNMWGGMQDASVVDKGAPSLLTFHGDQDKLIHVDYSRALHKRMGDVGAQSELHILEGKGHAIYKLISADYVDTIGSFLDNNL